MGGRIKQNCMLCDKTGLGLLQIEFNEHAFQYVCFVKSTEVIMGSEALLETITIKEDSKTRELLGMKLCAWEVKIFGRTATMLTDRGTRRNNSVILRDLMGRSTVQVILNFRRWRSLCFIRFRN